MRRDGKQASPKEVKKPVLQGQEQATKGRSKPEMIEHVGSRLSTVSRERSATLLDGRLHTEFFVPFVIFCSRILALSARAKLS